MKMSQKSRTTYNWAVKQAGAGEALDAELADLEMKLALVEESLHADGGVSTSVERTLTRRADKLRDRITAAQVERDYVTKYRQQWRDLVASYEGVMSQ